MIDRQKIEQGGLFAFLALITFALAIVVADFLSALLWAVVAAILFQPIFQRLLQRWPGRRNRASAVTLLVITFAVIIPAFIVASLVAEQASSVIEQIRSGQINFARYFAQVHDALPERVRHALDYAGFGTFEHAQASISDAISNSASLLAQRALAIGANAAAFLLTFTAGLYVTYFLLRDGEHLAPAVIRALPLEPVVAGKLADRFANVVRATVKGTGLVALAQGALGAVTFAIVGQPAALLWGVLMTVASLLPAIGPAIVWLPVAVYLLAIGAIWQGIVVIASGLFVIGLVDNLLRPMLVGRDTGIPDWVILVTTLGGIQLAGLSGIVLGPLAAALFMTAWQILTEQREATPSA